MTPFKLGISCVPCGLGSLWIRTLMEQEANVLHRVLRASETEVTITIVTRV